MGGLIISRRLLFLGFVLLGMASGFFLGSLGSALAAGPQLEAPASKQVAAAQQNSLIIIVDDLTTPQPALLGAWLAVRSDGNVSWMPLYPQPLESGSGYAQPSKPIRLASGDLSALRTLAPVSEAGVWFGEAFLLDQAGAATLSVLANGPQGGLGATWEQPQAGLQEQVQLIQALCAQGWGEVSELDAALALMPDHLRSSATAFELITRWDGWASAGFGVSCSHPWAE
jgi:hypothetical protein